MSIRDMFDHKYPITNLHELDLTYMHEQIDAMIDLLDSWEDFINDIQEGLKELDEINEAIKDLPQIRTSISYLKSTVTQLKAKVDSQDAQIQAISDELALQLVIINNSIAYNYNRLFRLISGLEQQHNIDINILKIDLDRIYHELLARIEQLVPVDVYNRVAGIRMSFDDNNFHIYEDLRYLGIKNNTLYELSDNDEVASLVHNNRDFALFMKKRLHKDYLYSPLSGRRMSHANAISELAAKGFGGCTNAQLYAAMLAAAQTNEDYSEYYDHNILRFSLTLS